MRRRLITYLDALFIGMLLGLIFLKFVHAAPLHEREEVQTNVANTLTLSSAHGK